MDEIFKVHEFTTTSHKGNKQYKKDPELSPMTKLPVQL